jgi:hypothetical protein
MLVHPEHAKRANFAISFWLQSTFSAVETASITADEIGGRSMSIFGKIKDAIFGHKTATNPESRPQIPAGWDGGAPAGTPGAQPAPTSTAAAQNVDVEQVLTDIAAQKGNPDLNYKSSIVDLMKLLGMDSSLENRKELATELGYTGDKDGSAEMNMWLHREVMRQLAANGGTVPASLTD